MNINHWHVKLCYVHFSMRLEERFGLTITLEEYAELCRSPCQTIKIQSKHKKIVKVSLKGKELICGKERDRNKCLTTVFPE